MNLTSYTTEELRSIIKPAFKLDNVIVTSSSYCNELLVEFSYNEPIILEESSGKDVISIDFRQEVEAECGYECCGGFTYSYTMVIEKEMIDKILKSIN
jgi:hypothetical protein